MRPQASHGTSAAARHVCTEACCVCGTGLPLNSSRGEHHWRRASGSWVRTGVLRRLRESRCVQKGEQRERGEDGAHERSSSSPPAETMPRTQNEDLITDGLELHVLPVGRYLTENTTKPLGEVDTQHAQSYQLAARHNRHVSFVIGRAPPQLQFPCAKRHATQSE